MKQLKFLTKWSPGAPSNIASYGDEKKFAGFDFEYKTGSSIATNFNHVDPGKGTSSLKSLSQIVLSLSPVEFVFIGVPAVTIIPHALKLKTRLKRPRKYFENPNLQNAVASYNVHMMPALINVDKSPLLALLSRTVASANRNQLLPEDGISNIEHLA